MQERLQIQCSTAAIQLPREEVDDWSVGTPLYVTCANFLIPYNCKLKLTERKFKPMCLGQQGDTCSKYLYSRSFKQHLIESLLSSKAIPKHPFT